MTRLRRTIAATALVMAGSGAVLLAVGAPATAQAPSEAAWWSATNLGDPAPPGPVPPDVKPGDLLVQGSNAVPATGLLGTGPTGDQAIAGLSFTLAPTDVVGALTLPLEGAPPPSASVVACRATTSFVSGANLQWADLPDYDADACVPAALKDGALVFAQISKLVEPRLLRVLLLPGPVDRVVIKKPTRSALAVEDGGDVGAGAPPLGSGTSVGSNPPPPSGSSRGSGTSGAGAPALSGDAGVVAPTTGGDLPPPATTTGDGTGTPPVVAGDPGATTAGGTPAAQTTVDSGMSVGTRRLIAGIVIALEVLGFLALMTRPAPATAAVAGGGALVAGGRLRAPDRVVGGPRAAATGGVGRFRRDRSGSPPPI